MFDFVADTLLRALFLIRMLVGMGVLYLLGKYLGYDTTAEQIAIIVVAVEVASLLSREFTRHLTSDKGK